MPTVQFHFQSSMVDGAPLSNLISIYLKQNKKNQNIFLKKIKVFFRSTLFKAKTKFQFDFVFNGGSLPKMIAYQTTNSGNMVKVLSLLLSCFVCFCSHGFNINFNITSFKKFLNPKYSYLSDRLCHRGSSYTQGLRSPWSV